MLKRGRIRIWKLMKKNKFAVLRTCTSWKWKCLRCKGICTCGRLQKVFLLWRLSCHKSCTIWVRISARRRFFKSKYYFRNPVKRIIACHTKFLRHWITACSWPWRYLYFVEEISNIRWIWWTGTAYWAPNGSEKGGRVLCGSLVYSDPGRQEQLKVHTEKVRWGWLWSGFQNVCSRLRTKF